MLLLDLVHRHTDRTVISYSFRGRAPLFDPAPFRLVGQPEDDAVALEAQPSRFALSFRPDRMRPDTRRDICQLVSLNGSDAQVSC